jgi:hypothetical protein
VKNLIHNHTRKVAENYCHRHRLRRPGFRHLPGRRRQRRALSRPRRGARSASSRPAASRSTSRAWRRWCAQRAAGRLRFTTDVAEGVAHGLLQFIAVGTPPDEDGSADLQYVLAAARNIGRAHDDYKVVVDKSRCRWAPPTRCMAAIAEELAARGLKRADFSVVSNPEFLKEGAAVEDFMKPDRIVVGAEDRGRSS